MLIAFVHSLVVYSGGYVAVTDGFNRRRYRSVTGANPVTRAKDNSRSSTSEHWRPRIASSHHIARWLAKRHQVYYLECPGLRAPKGSARDLKKIWAKFARFIRGPRRTPEGLKVWTLLQLPLHRFRIVRWFNRKLILGAIRWLKFSQGVRHPIAWFMVPHLASVVGRMGERLSVYYCIDDYSALPDVNEAAVRAMDEEMTRKVDLVFIAAQTLLEAKKQLNPTTRVSPHGVDLDHFTRARDGSTIPPADVRDLPRPIIGFFGLIEKWIDLGVDYLLERRPNWNFVMLSRVAVRTSVFDARTSIALGPGRTASFRIMGVDSMRRSSPIVLLGRS